MVKTHLLFALIFFLWFTVYDFFFEETISWGQNIFAGLVAFITYSVLEWTKIPYQWNKEKDKDLDKIKK